MSGGAMEIKSLKSKEKELLETVLEKTHWNLEKTSRLLKISVSQTKRKIKAYDIKKAQTA
jgi:DNA-binding NtrC family response regulator